MPLYEYQCDACEKIFEAMQKFSDEPIQSCPTCQAPVRKLMSMTSFALKGSGWYTTDYKRAASSSASPKSSDKPSETTST